MSTAKGGNVQRARPYLLYADAAAALEWLSQVLGFAEVERWVDTAGVVREAEIAAGETSIGLAGCGTDLWTAKGLRGPFGHGTIVHVEDVDAHYARAIAEGAVADPPEDQPYGVRTYTVTDPEGHEWYIWQGIGEAPAEMPDGLRRVRR